MLNGKILLLAGAAALLPTVATQVSAQSPETSSRPFIPPESPQILTRTLWRSLGDGKQIVVRRRYAVRFTRQDDGFLLDGRLIDAAVEAPPVLAAMAELERNRSDEGLFPLVLDATGRIREDASSLLESQALREGARLRAQGLLAAKPLSAAQQQESGLFLKALAAQGAPTSWPADLFNPAIGERSESRRIA
jgi:hypothetical protein